MKARPFWLSLVATAVISACAGSAPPTAAPPPPSSGNPVTNSWAQTVDAARKEGQLVVMGQIGTPIFDALAGDFQRAYPEITVDYTGLSGAQMVTKVTTERAAGLYAVDVIIHGTTSVLNGLLPVDAIDPILPALVGPDNSDPSKWRGGRYDFADEAGKYSLIFLGGIKIPLIYNPSLVAPRELTSYNDLLAPKWKGKIAMLDPRVAGSGLSTSIFLYTTPEFGGDFLRTLFRQQEVVFTKDDRQLADWVARGQYAIGLASADFTAIDLKARGVPVEVLGADALKEGTYLTAAWGNVVLLNRAPHPNAARVYLNWLLSAEGQKGVALASGYPSRRTDASKEGLSESVIPKPGVDYRDMSTARYIRQQTEITEFLKSIIND